MKNYLIIFLTVFCFGNVFAQNPNLGTSGAQFLQLPVGARSEAMGGAMVGLADDASAIYSGILQEL